jgi:hypothetical protein
MECREKGKSRVTSYRKSGWIPPNEPDSDSTTTSTL